MVENGRRERLERRLSAIISADAVGYSRLMNEDEAHTVSAITEHRNLIAGLVARSRGRVVDALGDNVLAEFASVVDALECAVEIQRAVSKGNAGLPPERRLEFRIGLNLGEVVVDQGRIYGSGVNIAARLESLATAGGILISGTVHDQVVNKLDLGFEFLGRKQVKNIETPIPVFRVVWDQAELERFRADGGAGERPASRRRRAAALVCLALVALAGAYLIWGIDWRRTPPAEEARPAPAYEPGPHEPAATPGAALAERPSIAVLPFLNLSGDPAQEYFSDGLTEDLITDLSKVSGLKVIARNSVFVYKGKAVKPEVVGRELKVDFVVEGSVRRSGERVRITAKLVKTSGGSPIWAERYDRAETDIFQLQDEVIGKIIEALRIKLTEAELVAVIRRDTNNLQAFDYALRGQSLSLRFNPEDLAEARRMFQKAIEADPGYASAYVGLGFTYFQAWPLGWSSSQDALAKAEELAKKALAINPDLVEAEVLLGRVYVWSGRHEEALELARKTVQEAPANPNALAFMGHALTVSGQPREALAYLDQAMSLNPTPPVWYRFHQGHALAQLGRMEEAAAALEEVLAKNEGFIPAYWFLTGVYFRLGREDKARETVQRLKRALPGFNLEAARLRLPHRDPEVRRRILGALKRAGLD